MHAWRAHLSFPNNYRIYISCRAASIEFLLSSVSCLQSTRNIDIYCVVIIGKGIRSFVYATFGKYIEIPAYRIECGIQTGDVFVWKHAIDMLTRGIAVSYQRKTNNCELEWMLIKVITLDVATALNPTQDHIILENRLLYNRIFPCAHEFSSSWFMFATLTRIISAVRCVVFATFSMPISILCTRAWQMKYLLLASCGENSAPLCVCAYTIEIVYYGFSRRSAGVHLPIPPKKTKTKQYRKHTSNHSKPIVLASKNTQTWPRHKNLWWNRFDRNIVDRTYG